jgi:hypothetical protein
MAMTALHSAAFVLYVAGTLFDHESSRQEGRTAHRLVDGRGLRRVPRDHAEHLAGLRLAEAGAAAGANVRTVADVAAGHHQGMGGGSAAPSQVGPPPRKETQSRRGLTSTTLAL